MLSHAPSREGAKAFLTGRHLAPVESVAKDIVAAGDTIIVRLRDAFLAEAQVPESIVHFVARSQESVILDDASAQNPYSTDTYIRQHHARSILCLAVKISSQVACAGRT
ncbi:MAG: hypothetical protein WB586_04765 [Chthoniobacterales bacterium]